MGVKRTLVPCPTLMKPSVQRATGRERAGSYVGPGLSVAHESLSPNMREGGRRAAAGRGDCMGG